MTNISKNNKKNNKKSMKRNKRGGEALTSGGFGCLFKPALKCNNSNSRTNGVSKLSIKKYGHSELQEIEKIRDRLKTIKNYSKYYLLDIDLCIPDKLTEDDLQNFDSKCYALTRFNITSKNVNNNLSNLTILNMPDGGIDLRDWITNGKITRDKIHLLNEIIIKLLKMSVRPMNDKGVIHNDLKDSNILIDKKLNTRIIDWGLASVVSNNKVPDEILDRPLQYNTPFSSLILSSEFKTMYEYFLKRVKEGIILFNKTNIRNYIINEYLIKLNKYYGYYDDNVVVFNSIFSPGISDETNLSENKKNDLIEYGYYLHYLSNYITDILFKYTTDKFEFDMNRYFSECYLYNADVFGLMTTYYIFFQIKLNEIDMNNDMTKIFLNRVRSMLVETIFANGAEKLNISKIISHIKSLNKIINPNNNIKTLLSSLKPSISKLKYTKKHHINTTSRSNKSLSKTKTNKNTPKEANLSKVITAIN